MSSEDYSTHAFVAIVTQVRSWTVSVVQVSVLFIHFGVEGVMDVLALDCERVGISPEPCRSHLLQVGRIFLTFSRPAFTSRGEPRSHHALVDPLFFVLLQNALYDALNT